MTKKTIGVCDICGQEIPKFEGSVLVVEGRVLKPLSFGNRDVCGGCCYILERAYELGVVDLKYNQTTKQLLDGKTE